LSAHRIRLLPSAANDKSATSYFIYRSFQDEKDELRSTNIDPNGSDCKPYLLWQRQTPKKIALEMVVEKWGFVFDISEL
jgi:hypothetical protein